MTAWLLTVWLTYPGVNQVWLRQTFPSLEQCQRWEEFYREYPFRPECTEVKS